ncbi:hypothetical protein QF027_007668 [Streptomyces canus]|nr:hypothetical protein [Streptomyces canus]
MDRLRVRPRLRRFPAPRWAGLGPPGSPPGVPRGGRRLRCRLGHQCPVDVGRADHRAALRQGCECRVHRAGRPVDHHHHVRRGSRPQQGVLDLLRLRSLRVLARAGLRRFPHRALVACHPALPRPGRAAPARDRNAGRAEGGPGEVQLRAVRPARRAELHSVPADPGVCRRTGSRGWLGQRPDTGPLRDLNPARGVVRRHRAAPPPPAPPPGHPAFGAAGACERRRLRDVRRLCRLPVPRHALRPGFARVEPYQHGGGLPAGRADRRDLRDQDRTRPRPVQHHGPGGGGPAGVRSGLSVVPAYVTGHELLELHVPDHGAARDRIRGVVSRGQLAGDGRRFG